MNAGDSLHSLEPRNRLAYLALHLAIQGDETRSERIRELIWRLDSEFQKSEARVAQTPVTV